MSENPAGPGGNGPAHTADPVQEPSGVEDLPDGTGQEAAKAAQPNVASSLLNAVLEGNSAVVTFLAIVTAIVIGGLLIAFSSPTVLHAWSHLFSAPAQRFRRPGMWRPLRSRRCSRAPYSTRTRLRLPSTGARSRRSSTRCRRPLSTPPPHPLGPCCSAGVPSGPVQHRRHRAVHRRGLYRRLDRLRRPHADDPPCSCRRDRRLRRGSITGGSSVT